MSTYMAMEYQRKTPNVSFSYQTVELEPDIDWPQSYALYGWLAGVRNYSGVEPLPATRVDLVGAGNEKYQDCAVYCLDTEVLFGIDYDMEVEDRRTTIQTGPNSYFGGHTCEPGRGKKMKLREFLGEHNMANIQRLRENKIDRIIMYFD